VQNDFQEIVEYLVEQGHVKINAQDKHKDTALGNLN
jgi:hypothetical protein